MSLCCLLPDRLQSQLGVDEPASPISQVRRFIHQSLLGLVISSFAGIRPLSVLLVQRQKASYLPRFLFTYYLGSPLSG